MTLADKIEALTDEECLSLTGPWRVDIGDAMAAAGHGRIVEGWR